MNLLIEKVSDLNDMIMQGEKLEAFDKFYHQEVIMQFNDEDPVRGKVANRRLLELEQKNITELKSAKPLKVTIGEKTTMVEVIGAQAVTWTLYVFAFLNSPNELLKVVLPGGAVAAITTAYAKFLREKIDIGNDPLSFLLLVSKQSKKM